MASVMQTEKLDKNNPLPVNSLTLGQEITCLNSDKDYMRVLTLISLESVDVAFMEHKRLFGIIGCHEAWKTQTLIYPVTLTNIAFLPALSDCLS